MASLFLARARDLIYQQACLSPLTVSLRPIAVVTTFRPIYPNSDLFARIRPNWNDASTFNPRAAVFSLFSLSLSLSLSLGKFTSSYLLLLVTYLFRSFCQMKETRSWLSEWTEKTEGGNRFESICLDQHSRGARDLKVVAFEIHWPSSGPLFGGGKSVTTSLCVTVVKKKKKKKKNEKGKLNQLLFRSVVDHC